MELTPCCDRMGELFDVPSVTPDDTEELNTKQERMIDRLVSKLAATENCPFDTKEDCPRPMDEREVGFPNGRCFKHSRRSRFGAECWRLWAMKGNENGKPT